MLLEDKEFDLFVASKIGSFKHIKYSTDQTKNDKKCVENLVEIKSLEKDDAITCMVWGSKKQEEILLGKKNKQVQHYSTSQAAVVKTVTLEGEGDIVGLGKYKRKLLSALSSGVVKLWGKTEQVFDTGALDCMKCCEENSTLFATGGKENDIKVWRIGDTSPVFSAKNLSNDWLELRQPVWVSGLCFLPGDGTLVAACSRYGYVRSVVYWNNPRSGWPCVIMGSGKLYDTRSQRRPVARVDFPNMAATCIAPGFTERQVLVGFGRGQIHAVDLRAGKPDKGFKGSVGAVTALSLVTEPRLVVSSSLDRHVRVHSFDSKELLYKQYLTSKLVSVIVQSVTSTPLQRPPEVKDEVKEESDMDVLFDGMEEVSDQPPKAKKTKVTEPAEEDSEEAIKLLLKSTEKKKKKMEKRKKEKKAKSVFNV